MGGVLKLWGRQNSAGSRELIAVSVCIEVAVHFNSYRSFYSKRGAVRTVVCVIARVHGKARIIAKPYGNTCMRTQSSKSDTHALLICAHEKSWRTRQRWRVLPRRRVSIARRCECTAWRQRRGRLRTRRRMFKARRARRARVGRVGRVGRPPRSGRCWHAEGLRVGRRGVRRKPHVRILEHGSAAVSTQFARPMEVQVFDALTSRDAC